MDINKCDLLVVGAGIVGLSVAHEYLNRNPRDKIIILEKEKEVSLHQTGRNSGVIHSGVYYKPNTLKAKNCIEGYSLLLKFANENNIPYEITGKLIVARNKSELGNLYKLFNYGKANKLNGLRILEQREILEYEPYCTEAIKALYVPQSGIIDYQVVCKKLLNLIVKKGGQAIFNAKVTDLSKKAGFVDINTSKGHFKATNTIVCCGVYSDKFISYDFKKKYRILPFKGEYYKLNDNCKKLIKGLIYPVPDLDFPFLGVHLTKTINSDVIAGPNAILSLHREGYKKFSMSFKDILNIFLWKGFWIFCFKYWKVGFYELYRSISKKEFSNSLNSLVPILKKENLIKGKSGIRAQIVTRDGLLLDDFLIEKSHNLINVINAPSPAATSSFSIAKKIVDTI